ncbi:MAG: Obg family GTPase CgtA, partial [Chloroflexi bacterium]|nr:Obg family GTPase CgtA [Chloroflexota bacterium]
TRLLVHLIDGTSSNPAQDFHNVNTELFLFQPALREKPQILVVNKIDLPSVQERLPQIKKELAPLNKPLFFISALTGEGIGPLVTHIGEVLQRLGKQEPEISPPATVFRPRSRDLFQVVKVDDAFVISGKTIYRLAVMTDWANPESLDLLRRRLTRMGVKRALTKAGAKPGDKVRLADKEMDAW